MKRLALALAALLIANLPHSEARAQAYVVQDCNAVTNIPLGPNQPLVQDRTGRLCGSASGSSTVTGSTSAANITSTSTQIVAAGRRSLLAIVNESITATIACAFGATASIYAAGSFTIPPGATRVWSSFPVPAEAVNCISDAASSAATIEVN
jgi:hypothetical protein